MAFLLHAFHVELLAPGTDLELIWGSYTNLETPNLGIQIQDRQKMKN